jgi:serine/threonine protein kinase
MSSKPSDQHEPHGIGSEAATEGAPTTAGGLRDSAGDQIGPYILLKVVGEGSFGVVWLAERREPIVQRVAIKIIKPGMESESVVARFEQERQALALMHHPHIAQVMDAGTSPSGRPYFVTDYVSGDPITTFCDRNRLTIRARLELFALVCEAVQHAHQKGVIHRDLKPANILVADSDAGPVPKIIDFGVAKALSPLLGNQNALTEVGQIIGTLNYMSPEQAEMSADIDTRSDVYSLGVVLYEILAGMLPFEKQGFYAAGNAPKRRTTRDQDAPKPSTRLSSVDADTCAAIAKDRREERDNLLRELARELEWIPLKALRPDRSERYSTPSELARDIRRYLKGEPLEAVPESRLYRIRKFTRRNRGAVLGVSAVAAVLMLGLIATSVAAYAAMQQSNRAEAESQRAANIAAVRDIAAAYIGKLLLLPTPEGVGSNPSREAFHNGAIKLIPTDTGDPLFESAILLSFADAYEELGQYDRALDICDQALRGIISDSADAESLKIRIEIRRANLLVYLRRYQEAEALLADLRRRAEKHFSPESAELFRIDRTIAAIYRRTEREAEAEPMYTILLGRSTTLFGSNHPQTIMMQNDLVSLLIDRGRPAEAVMQAKDAIRRLNAANEDIAPVQVIRIYYNAGQAAEANGDAPLAVEWHTHAFDLAKQYMGLHHPNSAKIVAPSAAESLMAVGQRDRAIAILTESIDAVEAVVAVEPQDSDTESRLVRLLAVRGMCYLQSGDTANCRIDVERAGRLLARYGENIVGRPGVRDFHEVQALLAESSAAVKTP